MEPIAWKEALEKLLQTWAIQIDKSNSRKIVVGQLISENEHNKWTRIRLVSL